MGADVSASMDPAAFATAASGAVAHAVLHAWGISPFAYKVRMAAAHKGLALDVRVADFPHMLRAKEKTGKHKTPFLVLDEGRARERWLTDSTTICRWIEEQPGPSLLPAHEEQRADCLLLEDWGDEGLNRAAEPWIWAGEKRSRLLSRLAASEQTHTPSRLIFRFMRPHMIRLWDKRAAAHGSLDACRTQLCAQLDLLERRLAGRAWLFGDAPTVADFAIAGQLANLVRFGCARELDERPAAAAMVRRACALLPWWTEPGYGVSR